MNQGQSEYALRRNDRDTTRTQQHARVADQEQLPPANPVDEQGARESHDEVEDLQTAVDERLGARFGNADALLPSSRKNKRGGDMLVISDNQMNVNVG